jgi:hypothetical protein
MCAEDARLRRFGGFVQDTWADEPLQKPIGDDQQSASRRIERNGS